MDHAQELHRAHRDGEGGHQRVGGRGAREALREARPAAQWLMETLQISCYRWDGCSAERIVQILSRVSKGWTLISECPAFFLVLEAYVATALFSARARATTWGVCGHRRRCPCRRQALSLRR